MRRGRARTWSALLVAASIGAGCVGPKRPVASVWPPPDFRIVVEELVEEGGRSSVLRRFTATADGLCVYARAATDEALVDAQTGTRVPVFSRMCAYRLLDVSTRLLARKLHKRGVLELEGGQGDQRETMGKSVRLSYQAFDKSRVIVATGQIHGTMARLLRVVNAHVPRGEEFLLPGITAEAEPQTLIGVPEPVDDLQGALACHLDLLTTHPDDRDLLLDAFALACRAGERPTAVALLQRWSVATAAGVAPPFSDTPQLTPEVLTRLLPP